MKNSTEQKAEKLALDILEENGFVLWKVEYVKEGADWFLKYYVDRDGGINIEECEKFNREISELLDETDFIEGSYWLEVSSPGMDRTLEADWHYDFLQGEEIEVKLIEAVEDKKTFIGKIISRDGNKVKLELESGEEFIFDIEKISKAKKTIEF